MHKHLWMSMDVMYISGFSATRECTDQLLSTQPEGTFLIRPSMAMEATLVISVVTRTRVVHLAINYRQLLDRSLEVIISLLEKSRDKQSRAAQGAASIAKLALGWNRDDWYESFWLVAVLQGRCSVVMSLTA